MKKEYCIKALKRIIEISTKTKALRKLGVEMIDFDLGVNMIEEGIATIYAKDEKQFEEILDWVQWWLYEGVDKVLYSKESQEIITILRSAEEFIDYIEASYK